MTPQNTFSAEPDHSNWEELCAVAAAGELNAEEKAILQPHLKNCRSCRRLLQELKAITVPDAMTARFIARGRSAGIRLSGLHEVLSPARTRTARRSQPQHWAWGTALASIIIASIVYVSMFRNKQQPSITSRTPSQAQSVPVGKTQDTDGKDQLLKQRDSEMSAELKAKKTALEDAVRRAVTLNAQIAELERENGELKEQSRGREGELTQLQGKIDQLETDRKADHDAAVAEEAELNSLRLKVQKLTDDLDKQRRLNVATSQVRRLMTARNLYMVDVHDNDQDGKPKIPFGRIFYEQGKVLIFYAYDLPAASTGSAEAQISFYVWGEKTKSGEAIRNLGTLHIDDPSDARWILQFDDPAILGRINSIFVTTTPDSTGKRFLSTRLDTRPNHP